MHHGEEVVKLEVFENERRSMLPPYAFGPGNLLFHAHFSDASGESSYGGLGGDCDCLGDATPPEGFEWATNWRLDKVYTQQDTEGWSYGVTYLSLNRNLHRKRSTTNPAGRSHRRRKWVRYAKVAKMESLDKLDAADAALAAAVSVDTHRSAINVAALMATSQSADAKSNERLQVYMKSPETVVSLCQERSTMAQNIVQIPWERVHGTDVVTPSILSVRVRIHRYFGVNGASEDVFQPADAEVFILNCDATALKCMINDRMIMHTIRQNVVVVLANGSLGDEQLNEGSVQGEGVPATRELSLGSQLALEIDGNVQALAVEVQRKKVMYAQMRTGTPGDEAELDEAAGAKLLKQIETFEKRALRMHLYLAALVAGGLVGNHYFRDEDALAIMRRDFEAAKRIEIAEDVVATVNNRIEFLMDMSELHLRDAALCGWHYRNGALERFCVIIVNSYLIEMVSHFGRFFEEQTEINNVKVL
jgi:hypothetical protein